MTQVVVLGASGFAGGELLRLIAGHPDMTLVAAAANKSAGAHVSDLHPQLTGVVDAKLVTTTEALTHSADLIFAAMPHGQSGPVLGDVDPAAVVVDLGADFRLRDSEDWVAYYDTEYAGSWLYGLPELTGSREEIAGATRIANPGCYPTAGALAFDPIARLNVIEDEVVVVAASGSSGAGRALKDGLLSANVMGAMSPYKAGGIHQHTPEMCQNLGRYGGNYSVSFTPLLAPMPRGIVATVSARLIEDITEAELRAAFHKQYDNEPFVQVLPAGQWPSTGSVVGSNSAQLQLAVDKQTNRVVVTSVIDNLLKGAAGQAVQNANIALGIPETRGLAAAGVAP